MGFWHGEQALRRSLEKNLADAGHGSIYDGVVAGSRGPAYVRRLQVLLVACENHEGP